MCIKTYSIIITFLRAGPKLRQVLDKDEFQGIPLTSGGRGPAFDIMQNVKARMIDQLVEALEQRFQDPGDVIPAMSVANLTTWPDKDKSTGNVQLSSI